MRLFAALLASFALTLLAGCTNASDDVGATVYAVCCGANCCCPGIGTGGRINAGDRNPENMCEVCDPSVDPNSWQPVPGCTPGGSDSGAGGGSDAGAPAGGGGGGCSVAATGSPAGLGLAFFGVVAALLVVGRRRR